LSKTLLPNAKPTSMAAAPAYVDLPNGICMESTTTERAPVEESLQEEANVTRDRLKKKRQRQNHTPHWQHLTRAQFPGCRFPAKFGCQPIKLQLYPHAHTYPANNVRVHFRHLGVYKESREA